MAEKQNPPSNHERYEKKKRANFVASSKLEGIEIRETPSSESLEDIIKKYTQVNKEKENEQ